MDKKYRYLVIDATNLYYRSFLSNSKKVFQFEDTKLYVGGVEDALLRIRTLIERFGFESSNIYFLFDNPQSAINVRRILSEGRYKHSRQQKNAPIQLYKSLNLFTEILKHYSDNYRILWSIGLEADDLTYPLRQSLILDAHHQALFISNDLDWARNITDYSDWYNWAHVYSQEEFFKKYKFWPKTNAIKMYKAIRGDASDCIDPGVPGLPEEILLDILEKYETIGDLTRSILHTDYSITWRKKIKDNENQLKINYQLVDFFPIESPIEDLIYECKRNPIQAKIWFDVLGFPPETWMMTQEEVKEQFFA